MRLFLLVSLTGLSFVLFSQAILASPFATEEVTAEETGNSVSLCLERAEISQVVKALARLGNFDLICSEELVGVASIYLKNTPVSIAMELALTSAGLTYQKEGHCYLITAVKKNLGICRKKIYPLNYFTAKEALELIKPFLKEGEIISADTQNHRLLIAATGAGHKEIAEILTKLDRPEKQVVLEAKIIELSSDAMKTAGIQWPPKIAVDFSQSGDAGGIWTTTIEGNKLSATLNLLEEKGYSRVLACPRLMVLSDKEAAILIGDRIPYQVSSVSASGNVTTKVEFIEAGIKLKIVPRINENQELTVLICPEVSYVYNWKGPASEIPWVKTRETKTTVRVKNGETIFIAGLLSEDEKEGLSGLPIFSQIPGVGNLFASKRKDQVKSEVVISITPKIVDY